MKEQDKSKKRFRFKFPIWAKTLLVLLFSISLVSIVAISFFSSTIRSITRNFYIDQSTKTADTLAIYVSTDDVQEVETKVLEIYNSISEDQKIDNSYWGEPEWEEYLAKYDEVLGLPAYTRLFHQLELFHETCEARYTYIAYADFDNNNLIYLVDDAPEDERCLPGSFDLFTEQDMLVYTHKEDGFYPEITNKPEYGYLASTGRPIHDKDNNIIAYAMVDLSMDEIVAKENANTRTLTIILVSLSIAAILTGFLMVAFLIVRPMRKLTTVANAYTEGENTELNKFAKVNIKTRDEIEDLSNSMKKMEGDMKVYINNLLGAEKRVDEMKTLADIDALTGVNNKRAYFEIEERLNEEIKLNKAAFSVTMIDLNDLKVTNDTLGHEKGDELILSVVDIINKVFLKSHVYRVGGDEFVILSEGEDLKNIESLKDKFIKASKDVSAAIGVAIFDKDIDNNVEDTFKRADQSMYQMKKRMKHH